MPRRVVDPANKAEYDRRYYTKHRAAIVANRAQRKRDLGAWLREVESNFSCIRCGENDPSCLDFHHIDPSTKLDEVVAGVWEHGWSKARTLAEIAKCVALCANCHRKLHAGRFELTDIAPM